MKALVIDLTHGGITISIELSKLGFSEVYAYDIYNTLNENEKFQIESNNIRLLKNLEEFKKINKNNDSNEKFFIISPIHCSLNKTEIIGENNCNNNYIFLTHHQAVKLILANWNQKRKKEKIPLIEITGVKGKTSTAFILKEIFTKCKKKLLLLSSLGAFIFDSDKKVILKNDISITPASMIETIKLSKKILNPPCNFEFKEKNDSKFNYESVIIESSLGVSGLGDIGILTNLVENYSIAKNTSNAREAKKQVFNCKLITIQSETLKKYYPEELEKFSEKINSFSTNPKNDNATVKIKNIKYSLDNTLINIEFKDLKTISGNKLEGNLKVQTFAPGKHNVSNVLCAITTCLSLDIEYGDIVKGLKKFNGIPGRTSKREINNQVIIEEVNPGLNVESIKISMDMIKNMDNYVVILGGKYGVTCEEINETELIKLLNVKIDKDNINLILTDELGLNLKKEMEVKIPYFKNFKDAIDLAIKNKKNILLIYRSKYSDLNKR